MIKRSVFILLTLILVSYLTFNFFHKKNNDINNLEARKDNLKESTTKVNQNDEKPIEERSFLRTDSSGPVDVSVALNNIINENNKELEFEIYLNTHSIDLENIDYANSAIIRTNNGIEIDDGFTWQLSGGSGHHISGLLKVPSIIDGTKILNDETEYLELVLMNIGKIQSKIFKWDRESLKYINY